MERINTIHYVRVSDKGSEDHISFYVLLEFMEFPEMHMAAFKNEARVKTRIIPFECLAYNNLGYKGPQVLEYPIAVEAMQPFAAIHRLRKKDPMLLHRLFL